MALFKKNMAKSTWSEKFWEHGTFPPEGKLYSYRLSEDVLFHPQKLVISFQNFLSRPGNCQAFHHRLLLKIYMQGDSIAHIDSTRFHLKPGDGIIVFPFQLHFTETDEGASEQYRFLIEFILPDSDLKKLEPLRNKPFTITETEWKSLNQIIEAAEQGDAIATTYRLGEFLTRRLYLNALPSPAPSVLPNDTLGNVFDYICKHYAKAISVKTLCNDFNIAEKDLRRYFKQQLGDYTPGQLIRKLRLTQVAEQLLYTNRNLKEIGLSCGFSDPFSLSRAFKNSFGCSPREYRKQKRADLSEQTH